MLKPILAVAAGLISAGAAFAQITELPDYAYDTVAEISMATTADAQCDGIDVRARRLERLMTDLMGQLAGDGLDPIASVQFLETEDGQKAIADREVALRERHGVDPEGIEALCAAIRLETEENDRLGDVLRIR